MCEFCNDYNDQKDIYSTPEWENLANTYYNVEFVIEHYRKKDNVLCGKLTTGKYKITYCPMCGRKLKENLEC